MEPVGLANPLQSCGLGDALEPIESLCVYNNNIVIAGLGGGILAMLDITSVTNV